MNKDAIDFLTAMTRGLKDNERIILSKFRGDPNKVDKAAWRPVDWYPGKRIHMSEQLNVYCTVSTFTKSDDGSFRRRIANISAGAAFMVDDIGTKVDASAVNDLTPSAIIETSPDNFQYWYFFDAPLRDIDRFDALIRAFITKIGDDPGMAGVNRVGRLPGFANGKEKYGGFQTRLISLTDARYSVNEIVAAMGLELIGQVRKRQKLLPQEAAGRNLAFLGAYKYLKQSGMIKSKRPDKSGWMQVTCPWTDGHTDAADNGAAIREPHEENGYYGAFRCHHGSCEGRGWSELTEWLAEAVEDINSDKASEQFESLMGFVK